MMSGDSPRFAEGVSAGLRDLAGAMAEAEMAVPVTALACAGLCVGSEIDTGQREVSTNVTVSVMGGAAEMRRVLDDPELQSGLLGFCPDEREREASLLVVRGVLAERGAKPFRKMVTNTSETVEYAIGTRKVTVVVSTVRRNTSAMFTKTSSPIAPAGLMPVDVHRAEMMVMEERGIPLDIVADRVVRAKLTNRCGNMCTFCHREGRVTDDLVPRPELVKMLKWLNWACETDVFHATGGEPFLHRKIADFFACATEAGMESKTTTNGQTAGRGLAECQANGLKGMNVSNYGDNVEDFLATQPKLFSARVAQRRIDSANETIATGLGLGLKVKSNIVIVPDGSAQRRICQALELTDPRVGLRFQPELSQQRAGVMAIRSVLSKLGAVPLREVINVGSSNSAVVYRLPSGREVTMKFIRRSRVKEACEGCPVDRTGKCQEQIYGIRLYAPDRIGVCIHRPDLDEPFEKFRRDYEQRKGCPSLARAIELLPTDDLGRIYDRLMDDPTQDGRHVLYRDGRRLMPLRIRHARLEPRVYAEDGQEHF